MSRSRLYYHRIQEISALLGIKPTDYFRDEKVFLSPDTAYKIIHGKPVSRETINKACEVINREFDSGIRVEDLIVGRIDE